MTVGLLLAIDTATRRAAIALGDGVAGPRAARSWEVGYHHSAELLTTLDELLEEAGAGLSDVEAIVAGTGPGSFTGLRVGLATAKALAYGLHRPIVGVASTAALALAAVQAGGAPGAKAGTVDLAIVLPAGPSDRYLARYRVLGAAPAGGAGAPQPLEPPRLVGARERVGPLLEGCRPVAVDAAASGQQRRDAAVDALPDGAAVAGAAAQRGLGAALLVLGRQRLAAGAASDLAELVPEYVTLPRGIREQSGEISWSRDLR